MSLEGDTLIHTDRMAAARAAKAAKANPPVQAPPMSERYKNLLMAQIRSNKIGATKRAIAAGRGIVLPDDDEPPFDPNPAEVPEGYVRVRCLTRGSGRISTGLTLALPHEGERFPYFKKGDVFVIPEETARTYIGDESNPEDRFGWVELVDE